MTHIHQPDTESTTMTQHTPGPWTTNRDGGVHQAGGESLCIVTRYGGVQFPLDARLIAAAPELLESLIAAVEAYDDHDDLGAWVAKARAAIAKAT